MMLYSHLLPFDQNTVARFKRWARAVHDVEETRDLDENRSRELWAEFDQHELALLRGRVNAVPANTLRT